jgi:pilus assembly protein CpaC
MNTTHRSLPSATVPAWMLLLTGILGAAGALAPAAASAQRRADGESITMEVGDQVTIPAADVASYQVSVEGVVEVIYDERSTNFVLAAQRAGVTSLLLIYSDGRQVRYRLSVSTGEETTEDSGGVPVRTNIRLDMYFLQLNDNYSHALGIGWPPAFGAGGTLTTALTVAGPPDALATTLSIAGNVVQALPRLDLAMSSGWGRVMRQVMVVTANGEEATVDTGGEVNFRIVSGLAVDIRTIRFGSILTVTPRYDSTTRRIDLQLNADISELTPPYQADGPPGRTRTTVTTLVNLELGESIVLGGLVARSTTEAQGGLPGLSQIPILGVLFGTNSRREENTENYLFIVPTVVEAVSRSESDRITEVLDVYRNFGNIGGRGLGDIELVEPSPSGYE